MSCDLEIVKILPANEVATPFALAKVVFCKTPVAALTRPHNPVIVAEVNVGVVEVARLIVPAPLVIAIFVPAVKVVTWGIAPVEPMRICPLVRAAVEVIALALDM